MTTDATPAAPPIPGSIEYGQRRDRAADEVERCRRIWHSARGEVDIAKHRLLDTMRAQVIAEQDYRAAVAAYEAVR